MAKKKHSIIEMQEIARIRGGVCISSEYKNVTTKLLWKCSEGHIFESTPQKILLGRWCRICGNKNASQKRRLDISQANKIAEERNGKCLSKSYEPKEKLEWECELGHKWFADLHNIKAGHWCQVCGHSKSGRKILTIDEMRELARSRGGKCLSTVYVNSETKLIWECSKGHQWEAIPSSIKKGHWCPVCAGTIRLDIEEAKKLAESRGGLCLSESFEGVHKKLKWQCSEGHIWEATYGNIQFGRWCPECSIGLGERICREYFEQIFKSKFPKARPEWLINNDGNQMELDGYNKKLALAFEHQGRQHIKHINYYHYTKEQFEKRIIDDETKLHLCTEHGIELIIVPQIPDDLPLRKIKDFIVEKCEESRINLPKYVNGLEINLHKAYSPKNSELLIELKDIAKSKGGECTSNYYLGKKIKLEFNCKFGHKWETTPDVILKGHWCPICGANERGKKRRLTIKEMNFLAEKQGGKCLSHEYINANTHLLWECRKGHQWYAIPNSIKRGSWCPICAKEKKRT